MPSGEGTLGLVHGELENLMVPLLFLKTHLVYKGGTRLSHKHIGLVTILHLALLE
jgi:hypothetical protein